MDSPRAKERYLTLIRETPELLQHVPAKTHRFLSVDHPAVTEPDSGKNKAIEQEFRV